MWQGPLSHYWIILPMSTDDRRLASFGEISPLFMVSLLQCWFCLVVREELKTSGMGSWYSTTQLHSAAV